MANLHYVPANGKVPEPTLWEQRKADGQEIQNEILRTRLKKLRGELVERREVEFVIGMAMAALREQILRLPLLVAAELRELSSDRVFAIRTRIEHGVHNFLEEASETLCKAVDEPGGRYCCDGGRRRQGARLRSHSRKRRRSCSKAGSREREAALETEKGASKMIHFPSKTTRDCYAKSLLCAETARLNLETAKLRAETAALRAELRRDDANSVALWAKAFRVLKP
jgi:hypothetical protein